MKILKYLLYLLLGIILLFLILSFFAPKEVDCFRSKTINADVATVWDEVNSLQDMHEWSPWREKEPNADFVFEGEEGSVGSSFSWTGGEEIGEGQQTITGIEAPNRIESELKFLSPYEFVAEAYTELKPHSKGGTEVKYGFKSETPWPMNVMNYFIDMDAMIGPDFERALELLDEQVKEAREKSSDSPRGVETEEKHFLGIHHKGDIDKISDVLAANYQKIMQFMGENNIEQAGAPSAIYRDWVPEENYSEYHAVIPVSGPGLEGSGEIETITLPVSNAVSMIHRGPYEDMMKTHDAISKHMEENNLGNPSVVLEEYIDDPGAVSNTDELRTNVVYYY